MKKLTVLIAALYILSVISASAQFSIDWLQFPTEHLEQGASVARDNADNSYSAGAADYSIYLTKRDKFGNTLWTTSSTSYLGETPVRSFVDPAGNAVVAAYRYSTLHEGPFAVALIVLKYTPAGNLVYKTVIPGTYTYFNNSLNRTSITAEMDGAGNIYFGTAGIVAGEPASGFNIVKVNSAGVKEWVKTESFGGSSFYLVSKIRLYNGLLGLSGPLSYISGNPGVWVADTTGRTLWTKTVSGVGSQDIAMDKKGNAYVTTFLTDIVAPGTEADICIYKFDKKGNQLWFKGYDFSGWEAPLKMIMAPDNTLVFAAESNKRNLSLYVDWLTIKIDTAGTMLWNKRYDKTSYNDEFPYALAIDAKNNVYVTGIGGPFPGGSTLSDRQGVVVKYNVKGRLQWTALFDTLGFSGVSIAVASDTSLFVLSSGSSALAHILQHNGSDACNVPSNLSSSAITNSTATIAWNAVPNAYLYHLSYKPAGSNTWIQLSTDVNTYLLTELFPGQLYDYKVEAICNSGPTGFSAPKQFTTTGSGYCASRGLSSTNEWIDLVLMEGISSVTGSDGGYADFTNLSTNLTAGKRYSITTSAETTYGIAHTQGWSIWIDYNRDGDFSDSGELAKQFQSNQIGWETHSFTVPASATPGVTRMRVAMKYEGISTPCEIFDRGEVEDYSINILTAAPVAAQTSELNIIQSKPVLKVSPNPAVNNIIVQGKGFSGKINLLIYDGSGKPVMLKIAAEGQAIDINVSSLARGMYLLKATDEKGNSYTTKWMKQ